ncbi:MAG: cache domain-containing protein [Gammaproteobacteria bacterium]
MARGKRVAGMLSRIRRRIANSLRYKLLLLVLFPILMVMPLALWLAVSWTDHFTDEQLYRKVNTDLAVADSEFVRLQQEHLSRLASLAESYRFHTAFTAGDGEVIRDQLQAMRQTGGFAFLHLTDLKGHCLFAAPGEPAETTKLSPLRSTAVQTGAPAEGVEIFSHEELERESPLLAQKAQMWLVGSKTTMPAAPAVEGRGLVLRMIYPVEVAGKGVVALLDGGMLLNRNFGFVDAIRGLVYGPGSVPPGGWGAVTVFLGDVRVSTNLPHKESKGERALGTRVPNDVRERVLVEGQKWIGRTFVANHWYISAYEPIADVNGERVGMLNTEVLEAPFRTPYDHALSVLFATLLLTMVIGAVVAIRGAESIFRPIEQMTAVVRAEQAGESRRIGPVQSRDEIGELARQFDTLLDLLQARNEQVRAAAESLEYKVDQRTRELKEQNVRLERTIDLLRQTRQQLVTAEKLAALGELTAGVAHEINNPTAVILGNMDIIASELGEQAGPVRTEIDLIVQQVYRIRAIVDQLLRYSRPAGHPQSVSDLDVNEIIDNTLILVRHELAAKAAKVERRLQATTRIAMNPQELQQVLVNLIVNAAHAIGRGGRLTIGSREWPRGGVVIDVEDDGEGIPQTMIDRVFDPFYTTRRQGSGLGLSVSYGLIRRYGGQLTVASQEGKWTRFEIFLHREPVYTDDEEALMERYVDGS